MDGLPCKKNELLFVKWKDAVGDSSRAHRDDVKNASLVTNTNIGWILHEDEERIVLAHGCSTSGEIDHFVIPKGDIVERTYVIKRKST